MGYTKVAQYGNTIEVFNYEKNVHQKKVRTVARRIGRGSGETVFRSTHSLQRAKTAFFRIASATLHDKGTPTFCTLTNFETVSIEIGYGYLRAFIARLRKISPDLAYISVPEWQKTGRLHFHCLLWGVEPQKIKEERESRFLQRQWARGYLDVVMANDASNGIALYMAKYMAKAYSDRRLHNRRAYSSSYNVSRPFQAGSNSLFGYIGDIVPSDSKLEVEYTYPTSFLGECTFSKYKVNYDNQRKGGRRRRKLF